MAVIQNLYEIVKIPASFLVANNCNIENYPMKQALKDNNIVSIGDNLVFQQIRYHYGDYRDHRELYGYIAKLRDNVHFYKKKGEHKKAHILEQKINETLFVKDIVNVYIDKKKSDFHQFRTKGFYFNGAHYVYLCSGSGQIRRNTATFINEELHDQLVEALNAGLDKKTSEFVLAKYSAYFALGFSSILWVRTPRVCVIKDFYNTLKNEKVDFICKNENGESVLEERTMDLELNGADGQGLIDPDFAYLWALDMDLTYTPCSFVARSCFVKGNLATFDFRGYAHEHGISTIKDKWGVEYNIDEIDVLLSESQFKIHKYYSSWQEYQSYVNKYNIHWGVARYNKKEDATYSQANYQYIQTLDLTKDEIADLIKPTKDWISNICSGDPLYSLLYAFGPKDSDCTYNNLYGTAQTTAMKSLVKNINFLNDSYVQHKIYKNISETINKAKLGKIWLKGNYQFMVADPVAQCQAALGLPVTGVVKRDEIYSKFWQEQFKESYKPGDKCIVDTCRSPMIDRHEHNPMSVIMDNPEADKWLNYMYSGIIYGIYDTSTFRHEDSDYDGDIVFSTDNPYFIKGSHKDHNIITYEKGLAKPAKMTIPNITATVMKGFGTGVGGFSNTATILYAMAAMFNKPNQQEQRDTILQRIKLLREIVGQEIDRIKGADKPSLPSEWKKFEQIEEDDSPEVRAQKYKQNSMVVSKKPYFFRYLYPELNQQFKQFEASYNQVSKDMFGIKFKKLLKEPNLTDEQRDLVRKYQKYCPLITSDCTMNRLCREFESIDFDIQFSKDSTTDSKKKVISMLPTFEEEFADSFSQEKFDFVKGLYRIYVNRPQRRRINEILFDSPIEIGDDEFIELRKTVYQQMIEDLQSQLHTTDIDGKEFLYYCHKLSQAYSSFNWGFAWDILEDQIIQIIPEGKTLCPVKDSSEDAVEYLGHTYKLIDISDTSPEEKTKLFDNIFGDPEDIVDLEDLDLEEQQ